LNLFTRINFGLLAIGSQSTTISGGPPQVDTSPVTVADQLLWLDGTGADQAGVMFHRASTLTAGMGYTIDMAGGGLVDVFGNAFEPARVKALYIKNTSTTAASLTIGGNNAAACGGLRMLPGESFMRAAGSVTAWPVAGGSTDTITITNASGSLAAAYRVVVIGATA